MGISVHIYPGDDPHIEVEGETFEQMERKQLAALLDGERDLVERIQRRHHGAKIDDFHLSDQDGLLGHS